MNNKPWASATLKNPNRQKARAKGSSYQNWIAEWLTERGWKVHNQKTSMSRIMVRNKRTFELEPMYVSGRQDIFGVFDLIAKKDMLTLWIQSTSHKSLLEKVKKIIAAELTYSNFEFPMIWMKRDSLRHDIYAFDETGNIEHPGAPSLYGKIISRKYYASENCVFEFGEVEERWKKKKKR